MIAPSTYVDALGQVATLSSSQSQVLHHIARASHPVRVATVAKALGMPQNTLRDILNTLLNMGLITRSRAESTGRGRPSWLYEATSNNDPSQVAETFLAFTTAVSADLLESLPDPNAAAEKLGRSWGKQILRAGVAPERAAPVPRIKTDATSDLAASVPASQTEVTDAALREHSTKTRLFFSKLGFKAKAGETDTEIELHQCPFLEDPSAGPQVFCQIHAGMISEIIGTVSGGTLDAKLEPFEGPGYCGVHLRRSVSSPASPSSTASSGAAAGTEDSEN